MEESDQDRRHTASHSAEVSDQDRRWHLARQKTDNQIVSPAQPWEERYSES